jgi:aryl-alcohol dehydrogenase-like predicted oxidoreductase
VELEVIILRKRQLGSSDLYVSEIGFGTMSLPLDEQESTYIIHKAIDEGINFIDTADLYQFGNIESLVGRALERKREDVILATKVGNRWDQVEKGWDWDPSKAYIKEEVHQSLNRLKTDYIDLYQLHGGTIDDPIDETIEAFEELKKEGLIRYYGISSIRPNVIKQYLERSNIVSIMMQYSLLDRRPEELLPLIEDHNVNVIARGPVAKGWLSSRVYNKEPQDSYLSYTQLEISKVVEQLKSYSSEYNCEISQLALKYPLHYPAVATVIPGASKLEQLLQNIKAGNLPDFKDDHIRTLKNLTKDKRYESHRI